MITIIHKGTRELNKAPEMSADRPGSTTYSAGFGPRIGTIKKADPYSSLPTQQSPRGDQNSRLSTPSGRTPCPPSIDPNRLSFSLAEQYKLKKYRDQYAERLYEDVTAFHQEEEARQTSARRQRELYRNTLQEQINSRSSSRESARQKEKEQMKSINQDFDNYVRETLAKKEHQHQRRAEYRFQVQQQEEEIKTLAKKRKGEEDAIAEMINRDAQLKKQEDEKRAAEKRQLQEELANEMKKEFEMRRVNKDTVKRKTVEDDRAYLAFVDSKAAHEEQIRANHIKSRQKQLPSLTLPKIDLKEDPVPNYLAMLEEDQKRQALDKAEQQRRNRETLQRQIEEREARKREERQKERLARERAEEDAKAYEEEQLSARRLKRLAAKTNEELVAAQISESVRRQHNIDVDEWKTLSMSASQRR